MVRSRLFLALGTALLLVGSLTPSFAEVGGAATYSGKWKGETSQGRAISFSVNTSDKVTTLKAGYTVKGPGCEATVTTTLKNLKASIVDGKFTVKTSSSNGSLTVKGTMVSKTKAKGTLKAHLNDPTGFGCEGDAKADWTAKR